MISSGANVQLKEGICNLQHEDMGVIMLVANQNAFAGPSHAMFCVVFFKAL